MAVNYSSTAIDDRLLGVVTAVGAGGGPGTFGLLAGGTTVSSITLSNPCGTVSGGVLTFTQPLVGTAANTGNVNGAVIKDSNGATVVSGLTVGIPLSTSDVIVSNGVNSTLINAGQVVQLVSAQIVGS
jgi:hypothetical protein